MAQKLTDRTIFAGTVDKDNDLIHLVDVSDTSQDPTGSSFSVVPKKFINSYISSGSETEGQTLYYDSTTGKFLNTSILHVDDGNNFIGIGITSALTAKLHVKSANDIARFDGATKTGVLVVSESEGTSNFNQSLIIKDQSAPFQGILESDLIMTTDNSITTGVGLISPSSHKYRVVYYGNTQWLPAFDIQNSGASFGNLLLMPDGGNVGIGTSSPNASAVIDLTSTTAGFLPPRMTTTQRDNIVSPAEGLVIYNTTTQVLNFYNGTTWGAV